MLSLQDIKGAVVASDRPIKGVIQGALTLNVRCEVPMSFTDKENGLTFRNEDELIESMTLERFHSTLKPRVVGTLNVHKAAKDSPLDFIQT